MGLVKSTKDRKYFAEVLHCAPDGSYLVQRRVKYKHPDSVPEGAREAAMAIVNRLSERFGFGDMHEDNWGVQKNGDPVIFDMGY